MRRNLASRSRPRCTSLPQQFEMKNLDSLMLNKATMDAISAGRIRGECGWIG